MIDKIKNKWFYIQLPNEELVFSKFEPVTINGVDYVRQILFSKEPINNGVYLLKKYQFEPFFNNMTKKKVLSLTSTRFDQLLSFTDSEFDLKLQVFQLVSENEINELRNYKVEHIPDDFIELIVS